MTDYVLPLALAVVLLLASLAAATSLLDAWIDRLHRRRRDRAELDAYRSFLDGGWWR